MDDDESIARLMHLGADGQYLADDLYPNPFQMQTKQLPSKERIQFNATNQVKRDQMRKMSLLQRIQAQKPRVPPCVTRATRLLPESIVNREEARNFLNAPSTSVHPNLAKENDNNTSENSSTSTEESVGTITISSRTGSSLATTEKKLPQRKESLSQLSNTVGHRNKHQAMSEYLQEKRELYLFQLFINRKKSGIRKFDREELTQEKKLKKEEQKITEEIDMYKKSNVQLEASLARQRHKAEIAAKAHSTLVKHLRHLDNNCALIRSEITKNEDLLITYRPYLDFLAQFVPENVDIYEFFKNPSTLIEELHRIENNNLFLIQYCQHYEQIYSNGIEKINLQMYETLKDEEKIVNCIRGIEKNPMYADQLSRKQQEEQKEKERSIIELSQLVRKTYINCFGIDADLGPLAMLERIENQLEVMFQQTELIDPDFLAKKNAARDKERKEQQRKERNEKRMEEQQKKIEHALERSRKAVPKRSGRPLNERVLPLKIVKPNDELLKQKEYEERMERELLYGSEDCI